MSSTTPNEDSGTVQRNSPTGSLVFVNDDNLKPLSARPNISNYLFELWKFRFFIRTDAFGKAFSAGRDTYLGKIWLILEPLLQVSVYFFVFGIILKTDRGIENFIGFLVIGVIFFGFVSKSITSGNLLIQQSHRLISSFRFPRASIVISRGLRSFYDNLIPAFTAVAIAILLQDTVTLRWENFLVIPLFLMLSLFNLGITFFVARATAFVPDLNALFKLLSRALFFTSGVFFSIERFNANPFIANLVEANPIYRFLMMLRECILNGQAPTLTDWTYVSLWSLFLVTFGFFYFWKSEERYASIK